MNLPQAISIILGANIGTTMTAQIIAFKLSDYIYIIIFIGFIISFIVKSERAKSIGQTIFAFVKKCALTIQEPAYTSKEAA